MGLLDRLLAPAPSALAAAEPVAATTLSETPVAVGGDSTSPTILDRAGVQALTLAIARRIPAVRKAEHVIAGTLGTFPIIATQGNDRLAAGDSRTSWLYQPDPRRTCQWLVTKTMLDLMWQDRCVWKIADRTLFGTATAVERIHPDRVQTVPDPMDPDTIDTLVVDGHSYSDPLAAGFLIFDGAGLGGLRQFGYDLLTLYGELQAAAGRYARVPHPYAILENEGADLDSDEVADMLDEWELARQTRGVGYTNKVIKYKAQQGWSAKELQLTEAREYSALEVARIIGLPAFSLDATSGDSMTYANTVDRRKDELRALSPWRTIFEQTISMDDRRGRPRGVLLPHGIRAFLDSQDYVREDAETRMRTWNLALEHDVLSLDEVQAAEPLSGVNR